MHYMFAMSNILRFFLKSAVFPILCPTILRSVVCPDRSKAMVLNFEFMLFGEDVFLSYFVLSILLFTSKYKL